MYGPIRFKEIVVSMINIFSAKENLTKPRKPLTPELSNET